MSLTAISLFESVRAKLFMNSTHNMCKNLESNVFALSRMNSTYIMSRKYESNVFGLTRPK